MADDVVQLVSWWLYDVDRFLRNRLESLKEDLASSDENTRRKASDDAESILDWLSAPDASLSDSERLERILRITQADEISPEQKLVAAARAIRSSGRRRGRPRDETSLLAIRALGLHLATGMSWREIAMHLKGCNHNPPVSPRQKSRKRNPNLSCEDCGEAMRIAVYRLRSFLKRFGYQEDFSLGRELDAKSRQELVELWKNA